MQNISASRFKASRSAVTEHPGAGRIPGLLAVWALVGWTLFMWVGRIRNILLDEALSGWSQLWRAMLALSFVGLAIVVAGFVVRSIRTASGPRGLNSLVQAQRAAGVLAIYGMVVWGIRGVDILLGAHSVAFKVVHAVLATVTIGLGYVVVQRFVRAESRFVTE